MLPEALGKRQQVARRRLEVEVKTVNHRLAEGAVLLARVGTKQVPDSVSALLGRRLVRKPSLRVDLTAQGEQDGLLVLILAGLYILPIWFISSAAVLVGPLGSWGVSYSIWGQSRSVVPAKAVQLSPAFAKFTAGSIMPFMKDTGMMLCEVSAQ